MSSTSISGYAYQNATCGCAHTYLLPAIERVLKSLPISDKRAFDLGCGNGAVANWLSQQGWQVSGVDPSETGIAQAQQTFPQCDLQVGSCYDPLSERFGTFPLLISLEVIEHVYAPRDFAKCVHDLLQPGGYALLSTPYHGYWKNLALAATGKLDQHFTALWDHGHIKFWSIKTLSSLLNEAQLQVSATHRIGRIPSFAKTMLFVVRKR